jgi:hypothetical protein
MMKKLVFAIGMASSTTYQIFGFWKPIALGVVAGYFEYYTVAQVPVALGMWNSSGRAFEWWVFTKTSR